jgi:hypothetical protein
MPDNYVQVFWDVQAGTGNVGAAVRASVAKAALTLLEHPDVIFASSAGGYDDTEALEVALLLPADYSPLALQPTVEKALLAEGLPAKVSLQSDVRYYDFGTSEIEAIERAAYVEDAESLRADIEHLVDLPPVESPAVADPKSIIDQLIDYLSTVKLDQSADFATADAVSNAAATFPPEALLDEVSISQDKYDRMKKARGGAIETEIKNLQDGLSKLSTENKTNVAVTIMIASGLVTVGKAMWTAYKAVKTAGGLGPMITGLIGSIGGVAKLAALALLIAAVITFLWALLKPWVEFIIMFICGLMPLFPLRAINDLILVNGTTSDLTLTDDSITNGVRDKVTVSVSAAPDKTNQKPMAYPSGIYLYSKVTHKTDYVH